MSRRAKLPLDVSLFKQIELWQMFTSVQLPPALVWNEFAACVFDLVCFFDLFHARSPAPNTPRSEGGKSPLMHL